MDKNKMPIEESQIEDIKKQLISQIESTFPDDKKSEAVTQIKGMNGEQLEQFLIQNNLVSPDGQAPASSTPPAEGQKCIFCSIVYGDMQSYKIDENSKAIAILELNPISRGHTLVIPKDHIESQDSMPKEAFELAEKVAKTIGAKLKPKPKKIDIHPASLFGHQILNILPAYDNETMASPKSQATPEQLLELQKTLGSTSESSPTSKIVKKPKIKRLNPKKLWLPKRIP